MKRLINIVAATIAMASLTGCFGAVKSLRTDPDLCDQIITGKSTEAQVKEIFGSQDGSKTAPDGGKIREYSRGYLHLTLLFDKNNVVQKVESCKRSDTN